MQEFVYYNKDGIDFPLPETIFVTNKLLDNPPSEYIVSNTKSVNAEIIANEIDFYIENSKDNFASKIRNVEKLYEVNAIRFDMAKDIVHRQEVENKVLLICSNYEKDEILKHVLDDEFDLYHVQESILKSISGHIGNLTVTVDNEGKDVDIKVDQIIWFNEKELGTKQSGCFDPLKSSMNDVIAKIRSNITNYEYKKITTYDKNICQYHERREEICGRCADVCPTVAIVKDDSKKHLHFSQIDCHGCGGCVSICPSGAIDYTPSDRETITEMAKLYKDQIPLIIPQKMDIKNLHIELKESVLPFAIEGEKFLHESTLLTLLQESGSQVVFYTDFLSKGTTDAIKILNQIYQAKYQKDAILVAMNEDELKIALDEVDFIENSKYTTNHENARKREIFAIRLAAIVGNDDLGVVTTGENVHYGKVNVNESKCTLCLSCVGACNVNAIFADASDNTLRLNPSLCTACGYCEASCPEENCLTIKQDVIELQPSWFKENILAQDKLFACVECGKEFATTKAIEKIAQVMAPFFASDPIKEKTLYCCETCKPKVMMKSYMKNPEGYNNTQGVAL